MSTDSAIACGSEKWDLSGEAICLWFHIYPFPWSWDAPASTLRHSCIHSEMLLHPLRCGTLSQGHFPKVTCLWSPEGLVIDCFHLQHLCQDGGEGQMRSLAQC